MSIRKIGLLAAALCAAVIAGNAQAAGPLGPVIPGQYIVVLKSDAIGQTPVAQLAQSLVGNVGGGQLLQVYDTALQGFAVKLPAAAVSALALSPLVDRIEKDRKVYASATQFNPPSYGLDRIDQRALPLDGSYSYPSGPGAGVHVYVIDTGLHASHTDFAGRVGNGRNFASSGGSVLCTLFGFGCPTPEPGNTDDCNGHGTHVSGTAVGTQYGVAKAAIVHPVRVLDCGGSGSNSGVIAGVDWVAANHQSPAVANMSLGGGNSDALDTAVRNAIASGVTFAVAAGNDNANACTGSPNRVAEAITVGATTNTDARASYSNFGSCVDLFAPGSNIVSANYTSDTGAQTLSGTSMASPHVAGAAALYLGTHPSATPAQVAAGLLGAATTGVVTSAGSGSPNLLLYTAPSGN